MSKTAKRRRQEQRAVTSKTAEPKSGVPPARSILSRQTLVISAALVAVTIMTFTPLWSHDFINYDDPQYVSENPFISQGFTARNVSWALTAGYAFNWHPLTWLSHMMDISLYGMKAGPHHAVSLALHAASVVLLFGLLRWMTGAVGRSAFVAGLFAIHPLHVESVAWIAERKDVLSTLLWMLTLIAYVAYVRRPGAARYGVMLAIFALGLMAKPMLVTLPFTLLLLDFWPLNRIRIGAEGQRWGPLSFTSPRVITEKIPLVAMAVASSLITFFVQRYGGAVAGLEALPLKFRLENAVYSYALYIGQMFWPANLAPFYPYRGLSLGWVGLGLLVLIAGSAIALWSARRYPFVLAGWLWYLVTLAPVIGVIQVGDQSHADRYTYVPLLGLFLIVTWTAHRLMERVSQANAVLTVAALVLLALCAVEAHAQVQHWQNSVTIWEHTLGVTTDNDLAHANLGIALWEQGKAADAIPHYREALRIKPSFASTHGNLGVALASQGDVDGAIQEFQQALKFKPEEAAFHYNLGVLLNGKGATDEARRHFEAALTANPRYEDARRMLDSLRR